MSGINGRIEQNENQPLVKVDVAPPDGNDKQVKNGIYAEDEVLAGIKNAQKKLEEVKPDRIITICGNCRVSLAPFDEHRLHKILSGIPIFTE